MFPWNFFKRLFVSSLNFFMNFIAVPFAIPGHVYHHSWIFWLDFYPSPVIGDQFYGIINFWRRICLEFVLLSVFDISFTFWVLTGLGVTLIYRWCWLADGVVEDDLPLWTGPCLWPHKGKWCSLAGRCAGGNSLMFPLIFKAGVHKVWEYMSKLCLI